jgi:hypothetical protein
MNEKPQALFIATYDDRGVIIDVKPAPGRERVGVEHKGELKQNKIEINTIRITEVMEYIPPPPPENAKLVSHQKGLRTKRCYQIHSGCQLWQV